MSQTTTPPPIPARPVLVYDGDIGDLFGVFLMNLILTMVTFGIFRFWAITRIRRYLWSHMRFEDTRFTYTGKGKELFFGFVLAMLILIAGGAGVAAAVAVLGEAHPIMAGVIMAAAYIVLFILFGAAHFSAQRYRLSRTEWRGIRGGMQGSAFRYGISWVLYVLLTIVTLYQAVPWMQVGLARRRINATRFGSGVFSFDGRARHLYLTWLGAILGMVVLVGVIVGVGAVMLSATLGPVFSGEITGRRAEIRLLEAAPFVIIAILAFSIVSGLLATWYYARLARLIMGHTAMTVVAPNGRTETLQFSSSVTPGALLWLVVSNGLIAILTLGFGVPIVLHRSARFLVRTTHIAGVLDADALVQSTLARPSMGEGFLQALDPGIV